MKLFISILENSRSPRCGFAISEASWTPKLWRNDSEEPVSDGPLTRPHLTYRPEGQAAFQIPPASARGPRVWIPSGVERGNSVCNWVTNRTIILLEGLIKVTGQWHSAAAVKGRSLIIYE